MTVLAEARQIADHTGFLFPSVTGKAMSDATLSKLLKGNHVGAVPHGFCSSFRDWAAEKTGFHRDVIEAALAHKVANKVVAAYFRTDLLEKRREIMQEWANYLGLAGPPQPSLLRCPRPLPAPVDQHAPTASRYPTRSPDHVLSFSALLIGEWSERQ